MIYQLALSIPDPIFDRLISEVDAILHNSYDPRAGLCENRPFEDHFCDDPAVIGSIENEREYCMACFREVG